MSDGVDKIVNDTYARFQRGLDIALRNRGVALHGNIPKAHWDSQLADEDEPLADPVPKTAPAPPPPLEHNIDFCLWLHKNFDRLLAEANDTSFRDIR